MKKTLLLLVFILTLLSVNIGSKAQTRRPVDSRHPLWMIHVDVWNQADPQKIIDLIPQDIRPYVCMNLSLSCSYDKDLNIYQRPQNAIQTYKSWGSVCQKNGLWFTCQPASGGHTHIQDNDLETFEYFFKKYPNFLGWNYAEQFWGFDEPGDKSSSPQNTRMALFAKLVEMSHQYGGFLTISFCGNMWSYGLSPIGMMKRNSDLLAASKKYPEAIVWLHKYTLVSCIFNMESTTISPFISGLANNYGVRYDNCGYNSALDKLFGENSGKKYPVSAGIAPVMEQTCNNGGAIWDGPELIWTEDFQNLAQTTTQDGYKRRNWGTFPGFRNVWIDMFRKVIDGTMYIPTRNEVVDKTKVVVINDVNAGSDEDKYAGWADLYDGLYLQNDPMNMGDKHFMNNLCYFKSSGRYGTVPITLELYDAKARQIPVKVNKSTRSTTWKDIAAKQATFNAQYPEVSTGDMYVSRFKNQLVTYTPYSYVNVKTTSQAEIPLQYNTAGSLHLTYGKLSGGIVREYADHVDLYLNNFRTDTTTQVSDIIAVKGASSRPTYTMTRREDATATATESWANNVYTLTVSHMGPVDVRINCQGTNTGRSTDVASSAALTADLPKQPEAYTGPVTIEAEDMDFKNISFLCDNYYYQRKTTRGHSGNGFAEMGTNTAGSLRHNLTLPAAGVYDITVRYSSSKAAGTLQADVNGTQKTVNIEKTEVNQWKKATFEASMTAGQNSLKLNNTAGVDMLIDQVIYAPKGTPVEKFLVTIRQQEHGTVTASLPEASEGEKVTLTATCDKGYALVGWEIIHGNITLESDNSFTMPEDNVTLQPIYKDLSSVYELDFTSVGAGAMPVGWISDDNGTQHIYPNTYSSGSRTFAGFKGFQGKGLYWRNSYAQYGVLEDATQMYDLPLEAGTYHFSFANAAWKNTPTFKAQVKDLAGNVIVESENLTATPNCNNSQSADVTGTPVHTLDFTLTQKTSVTLNFVRTSGGYDEYILLMCKLSKDVTTAILGVDNDGLKAAKRQIFNASGVLLPSLQKGLNIVREADGRVRKIFVK